MRQKFSQIVAAAGVAACLSARPAMAKDPHMIRKWGNQINQLLTTVMQLSRDPSQSARVNMGLANMGAGANAGSKVGGAIVGWAAGDEFNPIGKGLGGLFGADLGQTGAASVGATMDQAHNFLVKDQDLLGQIDDQLTQLLEDAKPGSPDAADIAILEAKVRSDLVTINAALPSWYNPNTIAAIRPQIPVLADNAQNVATQTDKLTKKLEGK